MKYAKILGLGLLAAALALTGCNSQPAVTPKDGGKKAADKEAEHAHGKGPNGGVVFDFGKHHAELTVDHARKELTVLILGNDEKTPVAVSATELTAVTQQAKGKKGEVVKPMTITLKPVDAKDGKASKFAGTDDGLGVEAEHKGTLFGEVNGKRAENKFEEE